MREEKKGENLQRGCFTRCRPKDRGNNRDSNIRVG
jgi:hypothetical protein